MIQKIVRCLAACFLALLLFGGTMLLIAWIDTLKPETIVAVIAMTAPLAGAVWLAHRTCRRPR